MTAVPIVRELTTADMVIAHLAADEAGLRARVTDLEAERDSYRLLAHKTEAIYRRYAIVDAGALRDAAAKIDGAAGTLSGTMGAQEASASIQQSA